jgi:hypothetical protein
MDEAIHAVLIVVINAIKIRSVAREGFLNRLFAEAMPRMGVYFHGRRNGI